MADGYARVTGKPGVCVLITGAGVTNAATAVASAYHDSMPMLVVSSATATADLRGDRGPLHDVPDQQALMATITAASIEVIDPADLQEAFARAFDVFASARPRPVHIAIPIDVLSLEAAPIAPRRPAASAPAPSASSLDAAAVALAGARRPFLLLGGGAVHAGTQARRVAALVGAPVGMTLGGKGALPDGDPLSVGTTITLSPVWEEIAAADVVLAVGTEFSETDYFYAPTLAAPAIAGTLVRIDIDATQAARQGAAIALVGESAATLAALADRLSDQGREPSGAERAAELRGALRWWAGCEAFTPFLDALDAALPDGAVLFADSTQPAYVAHNHWPGRAPRRYVSPAGFGTLGPALPMAIGAKVADRQLPVAVLAGDGGFLFTIQELATAVDEGLPLAILLWQNHGYGEIADSMDRASVPHLGVNTSANDFPMIARGFGCDAIRVERLADLAEAVSAALAGSRPTLIEVPAGLQ
jgi:acetolactate synthase-1/2/3 large subunit